MVNKQNSIRIRFLAILLMICLLAGCANNQRVKDDDDSEEDRTKATTDADTSNDKLKSYKWKGMTLQLSSDFTKSKSEDASILYVGDDMDIGVSVYHLSITYGTEIPNSRKYAEAYVSLFGEYYDEISIDEADDVYYTVGEIGGQTSITGFYVEGDYGWEVRGTCSSERFEDQLISYVTTGKVEKGYIPDFGEEEPDKDPVDKEETGSVYYLNFTPEEEDMWLDLAREYTNLTGVEVRVVTAAYGTYSELLNNELAKGEDGPTMFQISAYHYSDYVDYCMDLSGTKIYKESIADSLNFKYEDGTVKGLAYTFESFGIIVNKALLRQAGYDVSQITDFASLKYIAEDIHARSAELGFDAFASSGLDDSSSWRFSGHLATVPLHYEFQDDGITQQPSSIKGTYLDYYRNVWDLYIDNSYVDKDQLTYYYDSEREFGTGKAVFIQQGTWEYDRFVDNYEMKREDLQMIPIYCGADGENNASVCAGSESCWAVNTKVSEVDRQATLEFMYWVVTSDYGTTKMAETIGGVLFNAAKEPENVFLADTMKMFSDGKYNVSWAFYYTPNVDGWRRDFVGALTQYSEDQNDENWELVRKAFVDGWKKHYDLSH